MKMDIYASITNKIIEQLENGISPWFRPWKVSDKITRPLRANGQPYSGINIIVLWMTSELEGYSSPFWMTFKQCNAFKGKIRKGEKSTKVVYASTFKKTTTDSDGNELEENISFLKNYDVFNADQCVDLPDRFYSKINEVIDPNDRLEIVDVFVNNTQADIQCGSKKALYVQDSDTIKIPNFQSFQDKESYAATLLHELIHWTGHPKRLDRKFDRKRWGDEGYAMEELVAELGSAFLCADLQITAQPKENHTNYIGSWLKVLKNDKKAIFSAASYATRAVEYLHKLQPDYQPNEEE